jgi:Glyoxalase-like domain
MVLPVPVLDHVVVNVRDCLMQAAALYGRLGFTLTPQGRHSLGSINHLAMFGADYLELVGVPPEGAPGTDVLDWPAGLNGIVFGTEDSDSLYAALTSAGAPVLPPLAFSRPVQLAGGVRDAAFRTVRVARAAVPSGRVYFCQHLTRDVVWRDEWRRHPNGVLGVAGVVVAADDPDRLGRVFAALFGVDALVPIPFGCRLGAGLTSIDVVQRSEVRRRFGGAAPDDGRGEAMVALAFRVADVERTRRALRGGRIAFSEAGDARLIVAANETFGVALEFSGR